MNYTEIVSRQKKYFNSDSTKPITFRIKQLKVLKNALMSMETQLFKAIQQDFMKSEFETFVTELSIVYSEINENIKKLSRWSRQKRVKTNLINLPGKSYIIPEPLGATLIIGAWNYPYNLSLAPLIAAMGAGNTVILKPSEIPSRTSAVMAKLINEHFPSEYLFVVEGGVPETTALLAQQFDKIFFTGSTSVGKIVYEAAAKHLTPVTLELGGKSPAIITEKSAIDRSAQRLVWAKFLNAGQTCIAPDYILAHETIVEPFLESLKKHIVKNDYSFEQGNYVQIINEKNYERLEDLIDEKKLYYGGQKDKTSRYIAPTLLHDVDFNDEIMQEEIFGPLLPVITYSDINEVISEIKKRPKPLSCYIFGTDTRVKKELLHKLSFGGGAINDAIMHIANQHLPFGGVGSSGIGSYHGEAGFRTFSHYKSVLEKPLWFEPNLKYPPYNNSKLAWIKRMIS